MSPAVHQMTDLGEGEDLELLDPTPDVHALFCHYAKLYFEDRLGGVSVEWSSARMTLCGGTCQRLPGGAVIKLSKPLLSLRPSWDLKNVLLHEMIHAYVMVNGLRDNDPSGHGDTFKGIMKRINAAATPDSQRPSGGYHITVYHAMLAEVEHYRQHHWHCERCGNVVKRATNRRPQEADCRSKAGANCADPGCRWHMHLRHCGGTFVKIKEPEGYGAKKGGKAREGAGADAPPKRPKGPSGRPITDFFRRPAGDLGAGSINAAGAVPSAAHPAISAVLEQHTDAASASAVPAEHPSLEERRRLLGDAALRRVRGSASAEPSAGAPVPGITSLQHDPGDGSRFQPQRSPSPSPSAIDLLGSDDDEWEQPLANAPSIAGGGLLGGQPLHPNGPHTSEGAVVGVAPFVECPLCARRWAASELTNAQLNQHIDACLAGNG